MISGERHWLFGYGSLIFSASRDLSFKTISAIPAEADGLSRGWSYGGGKNELSGLGVIESAGSRINGVILQLNESELLRADDRELSFGYTRQRINNDSIKISEGQLGVKDKVWIFMSSALELSSNKNPICQSYLDVVLAGCLNISMDFAIEFMRTTKGWSGVWINDRSTPKYVRAFDSKEYHQKIDSLLQKEIPQSFSHRIDISDWVSGNNID